MITIDNPSNYPANVYPSLLHSLRLPFPVLLARPLRCLLCGALRKAAHHGARCAGSLGRALAWGPRGTAGIVMGQDRARLEWCHSKWVTSISKKSAHL